jgi:hypothetical protein
MDTDFVLKIYRGDQDWLVSLLHSSTKQSSPDASKKTSNRKAINSLPGEASQWRYLFSKAMSLRQEVRKKENSALVGSHNVFKNIHVNHHTNTTFIYNIFII